MNVLRLFERQEIFALLYVMDRYYYYFNCLHRLSPRSYRKDNSCISVPMIEVLLITLVVISRL